jgi:hypothetical protein
MGIAQIDDRCLTLAGEIQTCRYTENSLPRYFDLLFGSVAFC